MRNTDQVIRVICVDFGGVLAEEGFRNGLLALGSRTSLGPQSFFEIAQDLIYTTGYLVGKASESDYWEAIRKHTGIKLDDIDMKMEIINRFRLRPWMLTIIESLANKGYFMVLLSDQTNWLDELDATSHFCGKFDAVFNSYHQGKSKRDASWFIDVANILGVSTKNCLFIDDNPDNVDRASSVGFRTILFKDRKLFCKELLLFKLLTEEEISENICGDKPNDDQHRLDNEI
ncbi:MAG: HAD family hydrolase [Desulfomonilaceae bacterium]